MKIRFFIYCHDKLHRYTAVQVQTEIYNGYCEDEKVACFL